VKARSKGPLGSEVFFTADDRVAIVTGAGSGIGQAAARRLADLGIAVVLMGRRGDLLAQVAQAITGSGGSALAVPADLGDASRLADVVSRARN
jgi:NADP-dependent 3-hydroxy acid dehydrogenase YdfG